MTFNWKHSAGAFAISVAMLSISATAQVATTAKPVVPPAAEKRCMGPGCPGQDGTSVERNADGGCTTPRCFKPGQAPNSNAKRSLNPPSYVIIDGHIYVLAFRMGKTDAGAPPPYNPMPNEAYYLSTLTGEIARVFDPGGKKMDWKKYGPGYRFAPGEVQILSDPEDAFIDVGATDYKFNFIPTERSVYPPMEEIDTVLKVVRVKSKKTVKSFNSETGKMEYYNRIAVGCGKGQSCGTGPVIILMLDKVKGRWIIPPFIDPSFISAGDRGLFKWKYEVGPGGVLTPVPSL